MRRRDIGQPGALSRGAEPADVDAVCGDGRRDDAHTGGDEDAARARIEGLLQQDVVAGVEQHARGEIDRLLEQLTR